MNHLESKFTGAGGLELFHQIWQADASPKAHIALVHGIGEHSGRYPNVAAHFPPRGYTVHGFDLRGHGRSPGRRGHINAWSEFREDVRAYIRMISAQAEGKPVFIYGHSLGGLIALEYVLHYPDLLQGVIASAPAVGQSAISPVLIFLSRVMSRVMPTFSLQTGLDATAVSRDPAVVNGYADPLVHSFASARFGTEAMAAQAWTNAHAPDLKLPLLIVHGEADRIMPPASSRAFIERVSSPDKTRLGYEGGYHEPHNDIQHAQVMQDIEAWLEKHL